MGEVLLFPRQGLAFWIGGLEIRGLETSFDGLHHVRDGLLSGKWDALVRIDEDGIRFVSVLVVIVEFVPVAPFQRPRLAVDPAF